MKKILLLVLAVITQGAYAQTTVTYNHRTDYYPAGFGDGGSVYNVSGNSTEIGMWANYNAKQSVVWRPFKTAGDNTGQARTMAVGDEFSITIAATRAYGQIGVALLASPSTSGWADRLSNYVAQVNLDGNGGDWNNSKWYARYKNGATQASVISGSGSYVDYTIKFKLQSTNRMLISISNGTDTSYIRDVEINGTALPTHYSVYLSDDWNGANSADIFVKPGYLQSTGVLQLGYYLDSGSLGFTGVNNGVKANTVSDVEVNTVYAGGNTGTSVVFNGENLFSGNLTVNANATLSLTHNLAAAHVANVTVNGTLGADADSLVFNNSNALTLNSSSFLKIGGNSSFINAFATHTINSSSTVEYYGQAQQIATLSGTQIYGNLVVSGTGQKTLQGNIKANNLTVEPGTGVKAATGQTLTIQNSLVNNGQLVVQNNAALVQPEGSAYSGTGNAKVTRSSNLLYRLDYTLWGAPVTGQGLLAFSPATATSPNRFYSYSYSYADSLEMYRAVPNPGSTNFAQGRGYLIRMPNTDTLSGYNQGNTPMRYHGVFTGTPNNGNIGVSVMYGADNQSNHYVAVSNPYPSPISIADFFTQNSSVLQAGNGIYFWRKRNNAANSSYSHLTMTGFTANNAEGGSLGDGATYYTNGASGVFNQDWILSPGQGFLVKFKDSLSDSAAITFTNSMRRAAPATGGQPFFKTQNTNEGPAASRWWINLTGTNAFAQTLVGYLPQATEGLDYGYDAKIYADGNAKVYTRAAESTLAIQARPQFTDADVVPLGFSIATAGQYTLNLDHVDGIFAQGQEVYLKDNLLGTVTSLSTGGYTFTSAAGTFDSRFEVVYQAQGALGINQPGIDSRVVVYQNGGALHISAQADEIKGVTLYDVQGRKVYAQSGINATEATIERLGIAQQVLIVEVDTVNGKAVKKIVY